VVDELPVPTLVPELAVPPKPTMPPKPFASGGEPEEEEDDTPPEASDIRSAIPPVLGACVNPGNCVVLEEEVVCEPTTLTPCVFDAETLALS
jgi:hypothetical protein